MYSQEVWYGAFRTGWDFLTSLSWALGTLSVKEASQIQVFLETEFVDTDAHKKKRSW